MKTIAFNKLALVKVPAEHQAEEGCVAVQLVEYVIDYFGTKVKGCFDTKIGFDGIQRVHGGDGFFESGKVIA
jgi:hypothetical protein